MGVAQEADKKILVVDDSPAMRSLAESILCQAGYQVSTVTNAADAIEQVRARLPDLVLLDLSLPDLDGGKVCRLLKSDSSLGSAFIVMLLNTHEIKRQKELKALGADGFVVKPFIPKDLINQVESLVKARGAYTDRMPVSTSGESDTEPTSAGSHGYEWFVSEIQKEARGEPDSVRPEDKPSPPKKDGPEEIELKSKTKEPVSEEDGYQNFISQFKEEIKVEGTHEPLVYAELEINDDKEETTKVAAPKEQPIARPKGKETALDPDRVAKELVHEVASRVAQEIVENMDRENLKHLIRKKIEEFNL